MKIYMVVEPSNALHHGALAAFSTPRKAATYMAELARDGRPAELVSLEVNDRVQKSNERTS